MKIILDAMGGDHAPEAPVMGAVEAAQRYHAQITLVGRGQEILDVLRKNQIPDLPDGLQIRDADEVVDMHDDPAEAVRKKKNSSMVIGLKMLADGQGDAFISAGSTGALLSGATLVTKRIKGIRRAALAPVIPTGNGGAILVDCGANAECPPEYLLQFAYMGSYYAEKALGRANPKVALLNIGVEPSKGTDLQRETYALLEEAGKEGRINFVGNVEAREAVLGAVDVIVADGYSGNIFLKTVEGAGLFMAREVKKMFKKNLLTMLAALLVKSGIMEFKKKLDSGEVGGTALIGICRPVIKAHGSSDAYAIKNAVRQAVAFANSGIIENITENIEHMRLPVKGNAQE